jgi:glycosyltransferase involved in cell wall biosynthesis|tara:strand:- start:15600 stop:16577 length:978 start_codon:yes stop_codon:yes gene_type:complete
MTIIGDIRNITILSFNVGPAGRYVNGPGICLYNLINFLKETNPEINIDVFSHIKCSFEIPGIRVYSMQDRDMLARSIDKSQVIHNWSGLTEPQVEAIQLANRSEKLVILGPNCIDTVEAGRERLFLDKINFDIVLTVNERLRHRISKDHHIDIGRVSEFLVGPDVEAWRNNGRRDNFILWKGNSRHFVKDVEFGIKVAKKLGKYDFKFIGHPNPYDYFSHIDEAKRAKLYFSTSLSETMGVTLVEQWAAGVPSVTHPKIYMHGQNYKTGIITNRDIDSYCDAICEIMEDDTLHEKLSLGAEAYAAANFSKKVVSDSYLRLIGGLE